MRATVIGSKKHSSSHRIFSTSNMRENAIPSKGWSRREDFNAPSADYNSAALAIELHRREETSCSTAPWPALPQK